MKKAIALGMVLMVMSGCGIKRPLELPGHDKSKAGAASVPDTEKKDTTPPDTSMPAK